jgi:hypothetical protein
MVLLGLLYAGSQPNQHQQMLVKLVDGSPGFCSESVDWVKGISKLFAAPFFLGLGGFFWFVFGV